MPITDNLAIRIKAETGQTVITDNIASLAVNGGTGSVALIDDGTYGLLWRLTGGSKTATLSGMGAYTASVTTIAVRFRVTNRGDNYTRHFQMGADSDNAINIQNSGVNNGTFRAGVLYGGSGGAVCYPTYTTGTVKTFVFRFTETATDLTEVWAGTVGRSGTAADYTASEAVSLGGTRNRSFLNFNVATETLDLLDYAMWTRGLTDAEAAAVADDIRATIYPASGAAGNATGTLAAIAIDAASATSTGKASATGSLPSVTLAAVTATAAGGAGTPSLTLPALKNNTGTLLASETGATAHVYTLAGALVVTKTAQTTNGSGVMVITDAALTAATQYRVVIVLASGAEGMDKVTAA